MEKCCSSAEKQILGKGHYGQIDLEEVISESLVNFQQQGAYSGEINLRSSELLSKRLARCVKGQDYTYDETQHGTMNKHFVKHTKESQAFLQTDRNLSTNCFDEEAIKMLQSLLTRMELKKDDVAVSTLKTRALTAVSPDPDKNLELETFKVNCNPKKTNLSHSPCVHLNVKSALAKVAYKPTQASLSSKSKEKDSDGNDGSVPFKGMQLDFLEALKVKLQQKDLKNQQIAQLLLIKQQELRDVQKMSKVKEVEAQLMVQRLKCEGQKNAEVAKKLNNACEELREKLCTAKDNNESFVKQLKALMEKYERLKKRATAIKQQLLEERTEKKGSQKTVKKIQQMAEELLRSQALLENQRDTAVKELSACRKKMQIMEEEHKKHHRILQRVEEETSAIRAEYLNLKEERRKAQEETKKLKEAVQSKELEKVKAEKDLLASQNVVKQLYAELDESKIRRESICQELEAMKEEFKLIHNRHNVEKLQLQKDQKTCRKQFEGVRMECEALKEVVSKLNKDKHMLQEELERLRKEKARSETTSQRESQRMRETVSLLERERTLLLDEMRDLRKDYFSLSDRITQRLGQLEQGDVPMCITDISSFYQNQASKVDTTVVPTASSEDMIQLIRRKLEEEENQHK